MDEVEMWGMIREAAPDAKLPHWEQLSAERQAQIRVQYTKARMYIQAGRYSLAELMVYYATSAMPSKEEITTEQAGRVVARMRAPQEALA